MCSTIEIVDYARTALQYRPRNDETAIPDAKEAAVCLLLYECDGPMVLAILKADSEGYPWRNQIALPGGHISMTDSSPTDAALREVQEELGIPRDSIELMGEIGRFGALHATVNITAIAGYWKQPGRLTPDEREIARVFSIPLHHLWAIHEEGEFGGKSIAELGESLVYPVCPVCEVPIWGLTARVLHSFLESLAPRLVVCPTLCQLT